MNSAFGRKLVTNQ